MKSISGILHQSAVQRFLEALHWVGALHCRAFFWVSHGIHDLIPLRVRTIIPFVEASNSCASLTMIKPRARYKKV